MVRATLTILLVAMFFAVPVAASVYAQTPSPSPEEEEECVPGRLCKVDLEDRLGGRDIKVVDPAGDYRTSLITLGAIALVVGIYLYVALTGNRLPFIGRRVRKT